MVKCSDITRAIIAACLFFTVAFALLSALPAAFCFSAAFPLPACCSLLFLSRRARTRHNVFNHRLRRRIFSRSYMLMRLLIPLVFGTFLRLIFLSFQGFVSGIKGKLSWTVLTVIDYSKYITGSVESKAFTPPISSDSNPWASCAASR